MRSLRPCALRLETRALLWWPLTLDTAGHNITKVTLTNTSMRSRHGSKMCVPTLPEARFSSLGSPGPAANSRLEPRAFQALMKEPERRLVYKRIFWHLDDSCMHGTRRGRIFWHLDSDVLPKKENHGMGGMGWEAWCSGGRHGMGGMVLRNSGEPRTLMGWLVVNDARDKQRKLVCAFTKGKLWSQISVPKCAPLKHVDYIDPFDMNAETMPLRTGAVHLGRAARCR